MHAKGLRAGRSSIFRSGVKTHMDGMIFVRTAVFMHYIRSEVPFFLPATVLNRLCATHTHTGGYGFCHIPTAPGTYEIDCPTWIPEVCVVGIGSKEPLSL